MYAGKHDNLLVKILSAPGLWMQRLTTKEPDLAQIEVAITAFKLSLYEEFPEALQAYQAEHAQKNAPFHDAAETVSASDATDDTCAASDAADATDTADTEEIKRPKEDGESS